VRVPNLGPSPLPEISCDHASPPARPCRDRFESARLRNNPADSGGGRRGQFFDTIGELDIGEPVLTDVIFKSVTRLGDDDTLEFLALYTPEEFHRGISCVVESPNFEDVSLENAEEDSSLFGVTWHRLFGETGRWTNAVYYRASDKVSAEGEAFPDLVPPGTPQADIPVRPDILTVGEDETEIGWRSDVLARNRWGVGTAGLRIQQIDLDFYRQLAGDWFQFVYDQDDYRPDPDQRYTVWTPQAYDSDFRGELSYAAYVEQLFRLAEQARSYAQFLALEMRYHSFHSCPRTTVREVFVPLVQRAALGRAKAQQD
jgi:hypothetical protein